MTTFLAARRVLLPNTASRRPRKVVSYDFTRGASGYYAFGTPPALANVTDRFQLGRDGMQTNASLRPTLDAGKMNGLDAMKIAASSNQRLPILNARGALRRATKVQIRFPFRVDALPTSTQTILRWESGSSNVSLLVIQLLLTGNFRASIRMTGVGNPANINLDSLGKASAGVNSIVDMELDTLEAFADWRVDHQVNRAQALVSGTPGWTGGYTAFEDVDALVDPTLGRQGSDIDLWFGGYDMWTSVLDPDGAKAWWAIRQPEFDSPLPKVTIEAKSRAESCAVKRSRPGGTFEITAGTSNPGTNRVTSVTVNGTAITSAAVNWATSHEATAAAVAANINAYTNTSGYRAYASGPRVIVESKRGGLLNNGKTLAVNVGGSVTVDTSSQALAMGAVHSLRGTVIAGQANGDIKIRLLSWNDNSTETLSLRAVASVTGSTATERSWAGLLFVPMGAHILEARLGNDAARNATINTVDGLFSGIRILLNGQSNMKKLWAELASVGVFPSFAVTRAFQKYIRASGDAPDGTIGGHWDLSARILGSNRFVSTGESKLGPTVSLPDSLGWSPLNDGCGGNGIIRFGLEASSLFPHPIELVCPAIGSSGTPTRIPAALAPGAFEAGRNWDDFYTRVMSSGGFDFDVIVGTAGEEEANRTTQYNDGDLTLYEGIYINLLRSSAYCDENVPYLMSVMGPSLTPGAQTADPLRSGYTYAERIRREQLAMIYGGIANCDVAFIPLDYALQDLQHGNTDRYEQLGRVLIRQILKAWDPATYPTGCTGPRPMSITCVAGTNKFKVTFAPDGGTGLAGKVSNTNFTGWRFNLDGALRTVTASSLTAAWEAEGTFSGAASVTGQVAGWEHLPGYLPDASNALFDNGTVPAIAHPTMAPITCTVA
jgi:hypothetical protein